jgi:hypothetical protein
MNGHAPVTCVHMLLFSLTLTWFCIFCLVLFLILTWQHVMASLGLTGTTMPHAAVIVAGGATAAPPPPSRPRVGSGSSTGPGAGVGAAVAAATAAIMAPVGRGKTQLPPINRGGGSKQH